MYIQAPRHVGFQHDWQSKDAHAILNTYLQTTRTSDEKKHPAWQRTRRPAAGAPRRRSRSGLPRSRR